MTAFDVTFSEATGEQRVGSVPLSHVSVELGHLYFDDYRRGAEVLRRKFEAVAPLAAAVRDAFAKRINGRSLRLSTCYLVDDYFQSQESPAEVIPTVLKAATHAGLTIDYLARESACANLDGVEIANTVAGWIIDEPVEGANGVRPRATVNGWLSNGQRSPAAPSAMKGPRVWTPPVESARNRHSIFLDVELWSGNGSGDGGARVWSCPMLAAVWQLARLGLLRYHGRPLLQPERRDPSWPNDWRSLPGVIRLEERAAAFSAYQTVSLLDDQFLPVEHAVRLILSMVSIDSAVMAQASTRAAGEGVELPEEIVGRIGYVFSR